MKNTLTDLQNHLFASLERLNDEKMKPDVEREKAIAQIAQTLIESAKCQVKFLEVTQQTNTPSFFKDKQKSLADHSERTVN